MGFPIALVGPYVYNVIFFSGLTMVCCFLFQRVCRRFLDTSRYNYMRDLSLIAAWLVNAIWLGSSSTRFVVLMAVIAAVAGMWHHIVQRNTLYYVYACVGVVFAVFGPRISFIGLPDGQYIYLSDTASIVLSAFWIFVFPVVFQQLDNIPGMTGHLLAISMSLLLIVTVLSPQKMDDAFFMSCTGLALLAVFWSRHGHMYRRLGEALSAFWGVLIAGTSSIGVSKGITFSALLILPLGLFAIPLMETSLHFASFAFLSRPQGAMVFYRKLISKGMDHPSAVRCITAVCAIIGAVIALFQLDGSRGTVLVLSAIVFFSGVTAIPLFRLYRNLDKKSQQKGLWGIHIDNVSMDYAVAKVRSLIDSGSRANLVATVNALALMQARRDMRYKSVLQRSAMTLADGSGLVWALRFLGVAVQERVTGIDFMARVTRLAAAEGWPVYLLGGTDDIVRGASERLREKYPDLVLAGCHNGFFDPSESPAIARGIRNAGAKILFVGMGLPRQEIWIDEFSEELGPIVAVGVGGSFDVVSGNLSRAPESWQRFGMEWLYRLLQEPWRWKRDIDLFFFCLHVVVSRVRQERIGEDE